MNITSVIVLSFTSYDYYSRLCTSYKLVLLDMYAYMHIIYVSDHTSS